MPWADLAAVALSAVLGVLFCFAALDVSAPFAARVQLYQQLGQQWRLPCFAALATAALSAVALAVQRHSLLTTLALGPLFFAVTTVFAALLPPLDALCVHRWMWGIGPQQCCGSGAALPAVSEGSLLVEH